MTKIKGGYVLLARKILDSELMDKPPLWSKLWQWMLCRARRFEGQGFAIGEFFTTIEEMREAMSWTVGYRRETPSIKEIRRAYEGFTKGRMVGITKGTRGMRITILNFEHYQSPKNYEGHAEGHNENPRRDNEGAHYKQEEQEVKQEDLKTNTCPLPEDGQRTDSGSNLLEVQHPASHKAKRAPKLVEQFSQEFMAFYDAYPRKQKKQDAWKAWKSLNGTRPIIAQILSAIERQRGSPNWLKEGGQFIPLPATWLRAGQWEDEITIEQGRADGRSDYDILLEAELKGAAQ